MNESSTIDKQNTSFAEIEKDFHASLENQSTDEKPIPENSAPLSRYYAEDFVSDSTMDILLGYKNRAIVSILAKELGIEAKAMLTDLYQVTPEERKIYKNIIQKFIRENYKEKLDEIASLINNDLAAAAILELGRLHEARTLIKADKDKMKGAKVTPPAA